MRVADFANPRPPCAACEATAAKLDQAELFDEFQRRVYVPPGATDSYAAALVRAVAGDTSLNDYALLRWRVENLPAYRPGAGGPA